MGVDNEVLLAFYQRLFPFKPLFQWLNHAQVPTKDFTHRELAFTLQNDAYLRYQSFPSHEAFKKEVLRLAPSRFEIGPVYSANPRDRKTLRKASFRPLEKELVFDIDLTDYDGIRTCCSKTDICEKCWKFVVFAVKVVDKALREDFGFRHILWVYSGRRGAHAWVSDKQARQLGDQERRAIATYLEVVRGGGSGPGGKKPLDLRRPLHPSVARSLDILKDSFKGDILDEQEPWLEAEGAERLLARLPDSGGLRETLRKRWAAQPGRRSFQKWSDIDVVAKTCTGLNTKDLQAAKQDLVLEYSYPRLDAEVSKHLNHLLKSPFCIHPGTGRVCVPMDATEIDSFNPFTVPTVHDLLKQVDAWQAANQSQPESADHPTIPDHDKTSLKPYVDLFKQHVDAILADELQQKKRKAEGSLDF
ncbi:p48 polypeptide of DNA primase [Savitreella phatthalungensis]